MVMKWNKLISVFLLPLAFHAFVAVGHASCHLHLPDSAVANAPCCPPLQGIADARRQHCCCDQEAEPCQCDLRATSGPFEIQVTEVKPVCGNAVAYTPRVPTLRDPFLTGNERYIILTEPVPCFAVTQWRKISLRC